MLVRLLNRTTRCFSFTRVGQDYHAQITRILEDLDDTDRAFTPLQEKVRGTLRVTARLIFTRLALDQSIAEFLTANAGVSFRFSS